MRDPDMRKTLQNGLDLALVAHLGRLFSVLVDAASGGGSDKRFAAGLHNAVTAYEKALDIIEHECRNG
jgi:hypothetical protein